MFAFLIGCIHKCERVVLSRAAVNDGRSVRAVSEDVQ